MRSAGVQGGGEGVRSAGVHQLVQKAVTIQIQKLWLQ